MSPFRKALLLAAFGFVASCQGCLGCKSPVDANGSQLNSSCQAVQPSLQAQKLDILFVIDNSNSMAEEQAGVARELTAFVDEIRKGGGVSTDFRIGVITTSVYQHTLINGVEYYKEFPQQSGRLQAVPEPSADGGVVLGTGTERVLSGEDPDLVSKFARLVQQGTSGSGQETPFEAVRLALLEQTKTPLEQGGNGGFLRDGARLLVVVLTDEDDCSEPTRPPKVHVGDNPSVDDCHEQGNSLGTVSEYNRLFTQELKDSSGNSKEVVWTAIAPVGRGETKPAMAVLDGMQVRNIDCPTSNEPGIRHRQMAEMFFSSLINLDSICKDSYRDTLTNIAGLANISQVVSVANMPDPRMIQVSITRRDGNVQTCTLGNGLDKFEAGTGGAAGRLFFGASCKRRADDKILDIRLLCAT